MRPLTRRGPAAALALALAATVVLAQAAVAAPKNMDAKSNAPKAEKGAGHTKLPPGKGAKAPGHGGTPPGQAMKDLVPTQPTSPGAGKEPGTKKGSSESGPTTAGSGGTSSVGGTTPSTHTGTVRAPVRTGSDPGQGGSLAGGSPLGAPGWFNFRGGREFASDMTARDFRAPVDAFLEATRDMAFPMVLALIVVLFLLLQGLMDRRDPKLAVAPLSRNEILNFE